MATSMLVALMTFNSAPTQAQGSLISKVSAVFEGSPFLVQAGIMPALEDGKVQAVPFADPEGLMNFYKAREFEPVWVNPRGRFKVQRINGLLDVIEQSWLHGFNPYDYHMGELRALKEQEDDQSLYAMELLASDAVVRYTRDLSSMRVANYMVSETIRKLQKRPITEELLGYVAESSNVKAALKSFEPSGNFYAALQAELNELVMGQPEPYEHLLPIQLNGIIKPGEGHRVVSQIRERLQIEHVSPQGKNYYDDKLAQAVMAFQAENGLAPDGVLGPKTVSVMNVTREDKIERVIASLERLRWITRDTPERYILVNIPSAALWAIQDGEVVLEMPVILGRTGRQTTSFITEITGIRFNPNWTIPPTIKKEDFLPNLVENPYYATDRGVELVHGYGNNAQTLDPIMIDWANITWEELRDIRMIQSPGGSNPLGQMRVLMPNPYNIYLHDTNKRSDFQKHDLYISSGCIRVSKPEELAHFIMQGDEDWSTEKLNDILRSELLQEVSAHTPMPVFILYQTVWIGEDGHIVYGRDIYGKDRKLVKYMKDRRLFMLPESFGAQEVVLKSGR